MAWGALAPANADAAGQDAYPRRARDGEESWGSEGLRLFVLVSYSASSPSRQKAVAQAVRHNNCLVTACYSIICTNPSSEIG